MLNLMFITNNPDVAEYAVNCGINKIFIDLETNGKFARQGHLDTVISKHSLKDIAKVKESVGKGKLLVRVNPLFEGSKYEVEEAIQAGADDLMLPMFYEPETVQAFATLVDGRAGVIPLVETPQAMVRLQQVVQVQGVTEIYIGLNDLHLGLGLNFLFEPLAFGVIDSMAGLIKNSGLPFGFGGISRIGEGLLPAELVLAEHVRLGSSSVILSRSFHQSSSFLEELTGNIDLSKEISKLREMELFLGNRSEAEINSDRSELSRIVSEIALSKRELKGIEV